MMLLEKAKKIFTSESDQQLLREQEEKIRGLSRIQTILDSEGGQLLKESIRKDIYAIINKLIETREDYLISDLKASLKLYNSLKVKDELDGVNAWLEDILK